ncbi:unnamed protein product [Urochloa humidicola]
MAGGSRGPVQRRPCTGPSEPVERGQVALEEGARAGVSSCRRQGDGGGMPGPLLGIGASSAHGRRNGTTAAVVLPKRPVDDYTTKPNAAHPYESEQQELVQLLSIWQKLVQISSTSRDPLKATGSSHDQDLGRTHMNASNHQ